MSQSLTAGIYRVRDDAHKVSYIGYSLNIRGTLKRFRFELGLNSCTFKPLQAMYNAANGHVSMDVLEEIPIAGAEGSEDTLRCALDIWQDRLSAQGETVKVILL